jgi:hypothetical protein
LSGDTGGVGATVFAPGRPEIRAHRMLCVLGYRVGEGAREAESAATSVTMVQGKHMMRS